MTVDNKNSHHNDSKDPSHRTPSRASSFGEDNPENIEGMNGENELLDSDADNENDDGHHHHRSNNEDSESALVGSISHILRTLFRDLYQHPAMEPGTEKTKGKLEKINDNEDNEADNDVARVEDDINQPPEISTNIKSTPEPPASVKRRESSRSSFRDPSSDEGIAKQIDRPMSPGGFSDDDEENGDEEEDDGGGGDNEENKVDNENKNEFGDQSIEGGGGDDDGGGESRNNSQNFDGTQFNGTMLQNDSKQPSGDLKVEEKKKRNEEEEDGKEKLNANQRAAVEAMRKIDKKLEAQLAECSKTIQMLKEARKNAEIADKEEENKLKGRGILVSAHIPIGPSHLTRTLQEAKEKIKNDELAEIAERRRQGLEEVEKYPSLVSELISARSLMLASLNKHLYKSGNLKREDMIAINSDDDAEEGGSRGGSKKMSVNPADEHDGFLKMTKSLKVRKSMVLSISHGPNGHRKHKKTISGAESEMDEMLREAIDNEMYDDDEAKSPSSSSKTAKLKSQQIDKSSSTTHHHKKKEKIVNGEQHDLDMKVMDHLLLFNIISFIVSF
jgi:hypothetical protein